MLIFLLSSSFTFLLTGLLSVGLLTITEDDALLTTYQDDRLTNSFMLKHVAGYIVPLALFMTLLVTFFVLSLISEIENDGHYYEWEVLLMLLNEQTLLLIFATLLTSVIIFMEDNLEMATMSLLVLMVLSMMVLITFEDDFDL
eukprot:Awhi_evm1s2708